MSNGRTSGLSSVPATSRKMVQSLKEIVNFPEQEIYAMLKECNMDPNDTVNRLLSQDTFHEVKSKREKKKELKEGTESWSRVVGSSSSRSGRGASDRNVGRNASAQFGSVESGATRGKSASRKENGLNTMSSTSASTMGGNNRRPALASESVSMENTSQSIGVADGISLPSQPPSGFQNAWMGIPGQVSMADIVKMGRPQRRASNFPVAATETSFPPHNAVVPNASQHNAKPPVYNAHTPDSRHELHLSQIPVSKVSEIVHEASVTANQHVASDNWSMEEQPAASSGPSVVESSEAAVGIVDSFSSTDVDRTNLHLASELDDLQVTEGLVSIENLTTGHMGSASVSDRHGHVDSAGGAPHFDDNHFGARDSHHPQRHAFDHQEGVGANTIASTPAYAAPSSVEDHSAAVSSAAASLQQIGLRKEELTPPVENNPAVIIPNHLQVPTADCSHLSFGSFGSGMGAPFTGSFASKSLKNNLEDASLAADVSSLEQTNIRNTENYTNEPVISSSPENVDPPSSQPEVLKHDTAVDASQGHHYPFPSVSGYSFESTAQTNSAAYSYAQTNSQMQNLAPFSSIMQPYANSLPSNLMASNIQSLRDSDIAHSQFLATQSMPTEYSSGMSSITGPTMSMQMPEVAKPSIFSSPQATHQTLPTTSIPTGPSVPQHLPVPYSQPTLPIGHFPSMFGYSILPPHPSYILPPFQQAYAGNSSYHQSPAAVHSGGLKYSLPQYKNSVSVTSLPQSAAVASGYGGFASSANIPGSFGLNPSTIPTTTVGYEDVINSHYKDSNHFGSLQQNEGSAVWLHGPGSRSLSALPANTYYGLQGQNQTSGFRQGQQPSHYGALGYPNFFPSQTAVSMEHQQTLSDGSLSTSQAPPSQPSHQLWQHSY